ncbi:uncharacterized protein BX663DRAFT_441647 [Cokeromyces recurvatus]|uniref:uncharacterized protein n=1 Tax=Cokeromyces recurvatus TaxID=90255 RepID=UPI002220CD99|nr:uncharacterized protein BX663DRAFT_441647 [Cokeromyces recurvatus]KAI7899241.1 hypothetical protein BX663DRAFT_441647 [Cokeromyces recurvatus]
MKLLLGDYTIITRKIKLPTILREGYRSAITEKITAVSNEIRNIIIRAQLFVNYYIVIHASLVVDMKVFSQSFWYCIAQLVLKKNPENIKALPKDCIACWESFSTRYNSITYDMVPVNSYSHCLTAACVELVTTYTNAIVEVFESRVKSYMMYEISKLFTQINSHKIRLLFTN